MRVRKPHIFRTNSRKRYKRISLSERSDVCKKTCTVFSNAKQGTTEDKAERSELQYLSSDSEEETSYVECKKPGIPLALLAPEHLKNVYKFSEDVDTRKKAIDTFKCLILLL